MIEIKDVIIEVIYSADVATIKEAVEKAVKEGENLTFADLKGAKILNKHIHHFKDADISEAIIIEG